jgi:Protein of unknown function (DUF2849)
MQILTANRLIDGDVVFLTAENDWSVDINDAHLAHDKSVSARLEDTGARAEAAAHVIGCYLIDVVVVDGNINARHYREIMRAKGPTVRSDLGKQAQIYGSGGLRSGRLAPTLFEAENDNSLAPEKFHVSL